MSDEKMRRHADGYKMGVGKQFAHGIIAAEDYFNVVQFFNDDTYEYVRRGVTAEEAVEAARHYCTSVGARLGFVKKVVITDLGDFTHFEWQYRVGVVFPPKEKRDVE